MAHCVDVGHDCVGEFCCDPGEEGYAPLVQLLRCHLQRCAVLREAAALQKLPPALLRERLRLAAP
eukprot:526439-Alexandrium_andersonii.AAC.1